MNYACYPSFEHLLKEVYADVHKEWLTPQFKSEFEKSLRIVYSNAVFTRGKNFCPNPVDILAPYKIIKPKDVKVFVVGQDPYPKLKNAVGIAFHADGNWTVSLKAFRDSLEEFNHDSGDGYSLINWVRQGVLLSNITLTVQEGKSDSHTTYWENVVKHLIRLIPKESVSVAFGKNAKVIEGIPSLRRVEYMHPAERSGKFAKTKDVFGEINECLESLKLEPIDWSMSR